MSGDVDPTTVERTTLPLPREEVCGTMAETMVSHVVGLDEEHDKVFSHWTDLVKSNDCLLVTRLDERMFNDPDCSPTSLRAMSLFQTLVLERDSEAFLRDEGFNPDGLTVPAILKKVETYFSTVMSANANVLLFYRNPAIDEDWSLHHFAYSSRMAPGFMEDNTIPAVTMYGKIPSASLQEFHSALEDEPDLIDSIFRDVYNSLIDGHWLQRRRPSVLVVGYAREEVNGLMESNDLTEGKSSRTITEEVLYSDDKITRTGFVREFPARVSEAPIK